jgi:hypothetical protein
LLRSEVLGTYETEAEGHDILHEGFDPSVRSRFIR